MKYPDIWGEGMIFAFSGLEGETDWFAPFIAGTTEKFGSLCFRLKDNRTLHFRGMEELKDVRPKVICSDLIVFKNPDVSIIFVEKDRILGQYNPQFPPSITSEAARIEQIGNVVVCLSDDGISALILENDRKVFSLSYDRGNKYNAIQKAKRTITEKHCEDEI